MTDLKSIVEDTYAEGFRGIYGEILVTAHDDKWLQHCVNAVTGHASSTIMCDCEAGVSRWISPSQAAAGQSPDGRTGAVIQFHVPRFVKNRNRHLEKVMLARISQNVLTCPTARCFNQLDTDPYFKLGRKVAMFGDGHQKRDVRYGEKGWVIPILAGEFFLSRRFGYSDGVMGGNLWFMSTSADGALEAAELAAEAANQSPDVVTTFPGGVAASASKAGSKKYASLIATTFAEFCPTLQDQIPETTRVPEGVQSITEIIINGKDLDSIKRATAASIRAAAEAKDLVKITAGNYGGRLGKSLVHLHELL